MIGHIAGTFGTVVFTPLPAMGVSLFLIMSGYGVSESFKKKGLSHYWPNKISRVLIPYAIVITIICIANNRFNLSNYLLEITGIKTSYWYIAYQVKWYVIFFITMLLLPRWSLMILILTGIVMFLTLSSSLEASQSFSFVIGVAASRHKAFLTSLSRKQLIIIAAVFMFIGISFLAIKQLPLLRAHIDSIPYNGVQMIHNIGFAIVVITVISLFPLCANNKLLLFAGIISYELYLVHFPFYGMANGNIIYALIIISASMLVAGTFHWVNNSISSKLTFKMPA